jgi:K+:H+ antiporter
LPLKRIRQPRVIAEILGGILLSPSGLGRIPGFTQAVFPSASKPYLALVANIGLVLFMFLIGLEIEGGVIRHNARLSASIALSGMVIPFALGSAFSLALYKEFVDPNTEFTHFLLFIGVAFSITAFPVLCRILTGT